MSHTIVPAGYQSVLTVFETQMAITDIKHLFPKTLGSVLNLKRISAPLFVESATGLNDNLNGVERPVSFDIPETGGCAEVVHSLAKWKRLALWRYGFEQGSGLYTDMNAIRRDEALDNLHSVYVDQWDWEKVISPKQRCEAYLRQTVCDIVDTLCITAKVLKASYPALTVSPDPHVSFVTSQELLDLYPGLDPKAREAAYVKEHPTTFLMQIGAPLSDGRPHDGRAPDYDDWTLNGDLLVWDEVLGCPLELSSMGIRVDAAALDRQLTAAGCDDRRALYFHRLLLGGELPLTMGGGIGQSRLCMYLLQKAHIGEVQVSVWDEDTRRRCLDAGICLL